MADSFKDKRAAFVQSVKVSPDHAKSAKQQQFSSNNKGNSSSTSGSNKASAPSRGKALGGGRGNER